MGGEGGTLTAHGGIGRDIRDTFIDPRIEVSILPLTSQLASKQWQIVLIPKLVNPSLGKAVKNCFV